MNVEVPGEKYFTVIRPVDQLLEDRDSLGRGMVTTHVPCKPDEVMPAP
jgi:hypothetical protein